MVRDKADRPRPRGRWTYWQLRTEIGAHKDQVRVLDVAREFGMDDTTFSRVMAADPDGLASDDWTERVLGALDRALAAAQFSTSNKQ